MEGLPDILKAKELDDLPEELRFSFTKNAEMLYTKLEMYVLLFHHLPNICMLLQVDIGALAFDPQ